MNSAIDDERLYRPEIFALARSPDPAPLKQIGAEPVIADALDATAVMVAVGRIRPEAVINELRSLPGRWKTQRGRSHPRWH